MKRADTGLMILIAVVGTLFLATGLLHGLPAMKAVVGADCILRGDMPYRDFWTMYAPGQFYAVAALFALFGREFMVQGAVAVLLGGVSAAVFFRILRRLDVGRWTGAALAVAFLAMIRTPGPELTSYPPALLLILLSLDRIVSYLRGAGPGPLFRAGLMLGAAAIFKHDVAAYVAMGFAVSIILGWFALTSRRPAAWIHPARSISRVACGAILVALPVVVWLGVVSGKEAWQHLIVFPLTDFPEVRGEGYPSLIPALTGLSIFLESPIPPAAALHVLRRLSPWAFGLVPIVVFVATASCLALRRGPRTAEYSPFLDGGAQHAALRNGMEHGTCSRSPSRPPRICTGDADADGGNPDGLDVSRGMGA